MKRITKDEWYSDPFREMLKQARFLGANTIYQEYVGCDCPVCLAMTQAWAEHKANHHKLLKSAYPQ